MPTTAKVETVSALTDRLQRSEMTLVADYRGLSVGELTELRKAVREKGGEVVVAKNTLTRIAAANAGQEALHAFLQGPTLLAFTYDDIPGLAKALDDYFKASKKDIKIKGGILGSTVVQGSELENIAKMPTRNESIAKILGGVQAPASRIVGALSGVMRNIAYILNAHAQKEGEA